MAKQLLVEAIRIDGGTQSRVRISEETVAEYGEALLRQGTGGQGGLPWPAVTVFFDGTEYWMADGLCYVPAIQEWPQRPVPVASCHWPWPCLNYSLL